VLETLADQVPLILVMDDLQWADAASASLLFHLGRRLEDHPILLLGAYRPGDLLPRADGRRHPLASVVNELQRRGGRVHVNLDKADARGFVDALVDSEPNRLGEPFRHTLFRHTGGNPLFTVELLRGLRDRKDIVKDASGRWVADPNLSWDRLPARVEGVIAERIAHLPAELQEDLRTASVEGETFAAEVVALARGLDVGQVVRRMSGPLSKSHRLVVADSIRRIGGRRLSRYRFRHGLFQTYLYGEQDAVERAARHEAVGRALETLYGARATEISRDLAAHFEAARLVPKAIEYFLEAGKRASRLSAHEEAVALYKRGLALLEELSEGPDRDRLEFALRLALYAPLTTTQGYAGAELARSHARVERLATRLGQERDVMPVLISLAGFHSFRAEFEEAAELARRGRKLAESLDEPGHAVWASQISGMIGLSTGDPAAARRHLDQTEAFEDPDHAAMLALRGRAPRVVHRAFSAWAEWLLGYPDRAQRLGREAVELAKAADHPPSLALALFVGVIVPDLLCRDYDATHRHVEAFEALSADHTLGLSMGGVQLARGRLLVHEGKPTEGLHAMQEGLAAWEATGTRAWRSLHLMLLAEACLEADAWATAEEALDRAFKIVAETGERIVEPELIRLRGCALSHRGEAAEAEGCFLRAVEAAKGQRARSWQLRATTSLARHLRPQGRREEACAALTNVYERFTEGFDSPDLVEAGDLLDN
jgi:adenylate cyclase